MEKSQHIFFCETCQYRTDNKQHYKNHEASKKHKDINNNDIKLYVCECKKPYKSYMGFWRHKSKCSVFKEKIPKNEALKSEKLSQDNSFLLLKMEELVEKQKNTENSSNQDNSLLLLKMEELVEKQKNMESLIVELSKNQKPSITNNNNIINNVTILNILNTNYKDVVDFEKFILSIEPTSQELEQIKDLNSCINFYQNLISDRLKEYKINDRPFHCIIDEDHNAETFLKKNEWVKEYFEGFKNYMPILTNILVLYNENLKKNIDTYLIPQSDREKIKNTLDDITKTERTLLEIKEKICYSMDINKFELNHNLLNNK
jgi:hypothetical protein